MYTRVYRYKRISIEQVANKKCEDRHAYIHLTLPRLPSLGPRFLLREGPSHFRAISSPYGEVRFLLRASFNHLIDSLGPGAFDL